MSFATATRRFAAQAAQARADLFGGTAADRTADAQGNNLQIVGAGTKFRAAFSRLQTAIDVVSHGSHFRCTAKISLRRDLGIAVDETTQILHLTTGEKYEVVQIGVDTAIAAELPILLRRLEP